MPRGTRGQTTVPVIQMAREQRHHSTAAEAKLWNALRGRQVAGSKFRRQHPYGRFILDAYCVEARLEVEIDGGIHLDPEQAEHDRARTGYLAAEGIRVLRFKKEDVLNSLDWVLEQIQKAAKPEID